jgi:hypothetical protein
MPHLAAPVRSRLRVTTDLSPTRVKHLVLDAAAAAKGDAWHGRQKVVRTRTGGKADVYEVRDALGTRVLMTFRLVAEVKDGRTRARLDVDDAQFVRPSRLLRQKEPRALAHHTLRQVLAAAAAAITAEDPQANVKVRDDLLP